MRFDAGLGIRDGNPHRVSALRFLATCNHIAVPAFRSTFPVSGLKFQISKFAFWILRTKGGEPMVQASASQQPKILIFWEMTRVGGVLATSAGDTNRNILFRIAAKALIMSWLINMKEKNHQ
jgi:hypothetical protein